MRQQVSFALNQVIRFEKIYFAANWAHYDTAVPDTLRIVPNAGLQVILHENYQEMAEMFPETRLSFEEILTKLGALERRINILKKSQLTLQRNIPYLAKLPQ